MKSLLHFHSPEQYLSIRMAVRSNHYDMADLFVAGNQQWTQTSPPEEYAIRTVVPDQGHYHKLANSLE